VDWIARPPRSERVGNLIIPHTYIKQSFKTRILSAGVEPEERFIMVAVLKRLTVTSGPAPCAPEGAAPRHGPGGLRYTSACARTPCAWCSTAGTKGIGRRLDA